MENSKHTPGPWEILNLNGPLSTAVVIKNGSSVDETIAETYYSDLSRAAGSAREAEANAKLIAAAPELLQALNEINQLCSETITEGWHKRMDRIQAKAWGAIRATK